MMFTTKTQRPRRKKTLEIGLPLPWTLLILLCPGFGSPGVAVSPAQESTTLNLEETLLATIPPDIEFKPSCPVGHAPLQDATFSSNGRSVAYPAQRGEKHFIMFGNSKGPDHDKVFSPVFSAEGRSWAYWASTGKEAYIHTGSGTLSLKDGYDQLGLPVFSPDGKQIAFPAEIQRKRFIVSDRKWLGQGMETVLSGPVFSPDGSKIAYTALRKAHGSEIVAVGDEPLPNLGEGFEGIRHIVFSPNSQRIAFVAEKDKPLSREFVVCDGKIHPVYGQVGRPVFSPDSKRLAYTAYERGQWYVVDGGITGEHFGDAGGLTFSPDGTELAFQATKAANGPSIVVKGKWKSPEFSSIVWGPVYSPDGSRVAFGAQQAPWTRKEFIVVGDKKSEEFDEVWVPQFSPDGKIVVFGARIGRDLWWKVMAAQE